MVTHSVVGALPLGILITSDEKTETLITALDYYKTSLPVYAFFSRGPIKGPKVFMTDNCSELHDALKDAWPDATNVLCIFHILQQVWRWLHDKTNDVRNEDRPFLLAAFKKVLYADSEATMESNFEELLVDNTVSKYKRFVNYIKNVYRDRNMWAMCYRSDLPLRGNNTNNYCESQFLVIKDDILNRRKETNVVGLLEKLTNELTDHYETKLLSVASGKFDGIYSRRFLGLSKGKMMVLGLEFLAQHLKNQFCKT